MSLSLPIRSHFGSRSLNVSYFPKGWSERKGNVPREFSHVHGTERLCALLAVPTEVKERLCAQLAVPTEVRERLCALMVFLVHTEHVHANMRVGLIGDDFETRLEARYRDAFDQGFAQGFAKGKGAGKSVRRRVQAAAHAATPAMQIRVRTIAAMQTRVMTSAAAAALQTRIRARTAAAAKGKGKDGGSSKDKAAATGKDGQEANIQ